MKKLALSLLLSLSISGAFAQVPPNFGGSMVPNGGAGGGGGSVLCANLPALTGDVTTSAGSCATTLATTIGGPHTFSGSVAIGAGGAITSSGPGGALTAAAFAAYTGPYLPLAGGTLTGQLIINLNAAGAPTPATGTGAQIVGTDATIARMELDAFGANGAVTIRRANGTGASPTALASGDVIGAYNWHGYYVTGGPAYSSSQASIQGKATQNWTSTSLGTQVVVSTTPNNSTTLTTAATFGQDQSLTVVGVINSSAGLVGAPSINFSDVATGFYKAGTNIIGVATNGSLGAAFDNNFGLRLAGGNGYAVAWASTSGPLGTITTTLSQATSGVLQVGTTAANALGSLNLATLTATGQIISSTSGTNSAPSVAIGGSNQGLYGSGNMIYGAAGAAYWLTNTAQFRFASSMVFGFASGDPSATAADTILTRAAAATWQHGAADVASGAVAQFVTFQGNTGSSTTGPLATVKGAVGGTGAASVGGEVRIQGGITSAAAGIGGAVTIYGGGALGAGTTPVLGLTVAANGAVSVNDTITANQFVASTVITMGSNTASVRIANNYVYGWVNGTNAVSGTIDTNISRFAAGQIQIGGASAGATGFLVAAGVSIGGAAGVGGGIDINYTTTGLNINSSTGIFWYNSGRQTSITQASNGVLQLGTGVANALGSLNLTNLTATGVLNAAAGSVGAPAINFSDATTGFYRTGSNAIGIALNGVLNTTIDTSNFTIGGGGVLNLRPANDGSGNLGDITHRWGDTYIFKSIFFGAGDTIIRSGGAATLQLGAADVASGAVAQTLQVQSNTGTTTTGPDFSIVGSGGTTAGGNILIKVKATTTAATALTITPVGALVGGASTDAAASSGSGALQIVGGASIAKRFWLPAITTSSGLQTAVLCQSSGGEVIADSVACLASSEDFKEEIQPSDMGLATAMALQPITYRYRATGNPRFDSAPNQRAIHAGIGAKQAATIDQRLVAYDREGKVHTIRPDSMISVLLKSVQELKAANDNIRTELETLKRANAR